MSTNIKDVVKEKYGQAALCVVNGGSSCCGAAAAVWLRLFPALPDGVEVAAMQYAERGSVHGR
jgi:hypothetical protein